MAMRLRGVSVCALPFTAALLAFSINGQPAAEAAQQSQMRYAAMDGNGDGVITRNEWRGTLAAFAAADWNNDGVLSGREVMTQTQGTATTRRPGDFDLTIDDRNDAAERFVYLDSNRNGWVERREWRGTTASFNALDRNGDAVLTRAEMAAQGGGAVGTSGTTTVRGRFEEMDADNDGAINANEWFGTRLGFNRVDTNRDGVVTRREYRLNQNGAAGNPAPGAANRRQVNAQVVDIDSRQQWVNTGIYIEPGDVVTFDAEGSATLSNNGNDVASPDGARSGRRADAAPLSNQPAGALIGRIGNSATFMIGSNQVMRANETGELLLGVNDDHTPDNRGVFRVRVSIR